KRMAIKQFLDFVMVSSADSVTFAESNNSPPLWVIDRRLFAGQPSSSISSGTRFHTTITTIALTGGPLSFVGSANSSSWFHDGKIHDTIVDRNGAGGTPPGTRG